jgi:hypothetical protein
MSCKRTVISLFLLLTYTLGFGHDVIPHQHNSDTHHHAETHHHHDGATHKHEHKQHDHVAHGNHFDSSLYDLIICFLSEASHATEECEFTHYTLSNTASAAKNTTQASSTISLYSSIVAETTNNTNGDDFNFSSINYRPRRIASSPLRGPPTFILA